MTETVVKSSPPLSYTQKLSLIAGSATVLYFLPSEAQAADIIYTNTNPVTITFADNGSTVGWDVDGNGSDDFNLVAGGTFFGQRFIRLSSNGLSGQGFVRDNNQGTDEDILWLQPNVIVTNTLGVNGPIDYVWGGLAVVNRTVLSLVNSTFAHPDVIIPASQEFPPTGDPRTATGFFGFRFLDTAGDLHYGWGEMQLVADQGTPGNSRVTITQWAYNAVGCGVGIPLNSPCGNPGVDGSAIEVGNTGGGGTPQVPEPTSPLALLALGAAGVYRWRKERQETGN